LADLQVVALGPSGRPSLKGLFTDRRSGASASPYDEANLAEHVGDDIDAVRSNRADLEGRAARDIVWMRQVHGDAVAVVDSVTGQPVDGVDALVTTSRDIALGVLVADCVPVLLADINAGVVGAAHVGRRGLVAGTALRAVDTMTQLDATPADIEVWLGPSICGRCYEVPAKMRAEVESAAPGSATATSNGRPGVDLRTGLRRQLLGAGISAVRDVGPCTAESTDHYSYRRDGVTGRFAGVVMLATS
jgi:YfiH family protein